MEVGGVPCVPADQSHRDLIMGQEDTQVVLSVLREGAVRSFTVTRRAIHIPNTQILLLEGAWAT